MGSYKILEKWRFSLSRKRSKSLYYYYFKNCRFVLRLLHLRVKHMHVQSAGKWLRYIHLPAHPSIYPLNLTLIIPCTSCPPVEVSIEDEYRKPWWCRRAQQSRVGSKWARRTCFLLLCCTNLGRKKSWHPPAHSCSNRRVEECSTQMTTPRKEPLHQLHACVKQCIEP